MTLVEVMAVLFIVGLTAGIVTLTLPDNPTAEEASAQAFARVLSDAQDRAIMAEGIARAFFPQRGCNLKGRGAAARGRGEDLGGGGLINKKKHYPTTHTR